MYKASMSFQKMARAQLNREEGISVRPKGDGSCEFRCKVS